jgi:Na+/H+-dicarboxylate symporter/ABC-type amino acid transport substrate-binding protein
MTNRAAAVATVAPSPARSAASTASKRIRNGVLAGAAVGLFFGEYAAILRVVADGFVRLLQMTVLPYVTISIVAGLGALDYEQARVLGKRVGAVLALLWAVAIGAALLIALMFPRHESASFFSTALVEDRERFDFLGLYIPTNPFNSLANNIVPAVVLFSLFVGLALISVPRKGRLIEVLTIANAAIGNATNFIVSLTPYGVFAISAVVAGTLDFATLTRLEVYLVSYIGVSLFLSLWLLPGLVAALTPVPFRAIVSRTRDALVLAFMTTSLFAVLPMLTEEAKALLREHVDKGERAETLPDVIVPVSFNFPHTGKLLSLSFVLFAAWFSDTLVPAGGYLRLMGTGLLVMFGNVNAAIPFLLDLLRIPSDTFQLFLTSGVINARFGTVVAAAHTVTVAIVGTCAVVGAVRFNARKLLRFGVITLFAAAALIGGVRAVLHFGVRSAYDLDTVIATMEAVRDRGDARVYKTGDRVDSLPPAGSIVERMRRRGAVRVGYFDDSLPYAFFNRRGELVGLDVEMAQQLGRDLGVSVEFVPVNRAVLQSGLDAAVCDIIMSGAVVTADRVLNVQFSQPYLDETLAFVVPDHRISAFSEWSSVRAMGAVRIGVPRAPYFMRRIREELPQAELVPIEAADEVFTPRDPPLDAFVLTAERGSTYTLLHPAYAVVVPKPRPLKVPLAYIVAGRDREMTALVDTWIDLKRKDGTIDELFGHWILGRDAASKQPRWSVLRNVLHVGV